MILYHNPRCRKSREALTHLSDKGHSPLIREYLKTIPSKVELKEILEKLGIKAEELVRKNEKDYKENFKGMDMSDDQWIEAMIKFPKLIQRPILLHEGKAVIGRPPELVLDII